MRFRITYSEGCGPDEFEEINTLDDLFAFARKKGYNLIFTIFDETRVDSLELKEPIIEVYDGYRE